MTCGCEEVSGGIKMSRQLRSLNTAREAIAGGVEELIKEVPPNEENLPNWVLLHKTLLKVAGDVEDVVQTIKDSREGAHVDHTT